MAFNKQIKNMKVSQENYDRKSQLTHVEREQVDIRADIKIIQHDIIAIKDNMATKTDLQLLEVKVESHIKDTENRLEAKIKDTENRLEAKISLINSNIGWLKVLNLAILTTVLGIAFAPLAQNMFKAPAQEVIPSKN